MVHQIHEAVILFVPKKFTIPSFSTPKSNCDNNFCNIPISFNNFDHKPNAIAYLRLFPNCPYVFGGPDPGGKSFYLHRLLSMNLSPASTCLVNLYAVTSPRFSKIYHWRATIFILTIYLPFLRDGGINKLYYYAYICLLLQVDSTYANTIPCKRPL